MENKKRTILTIVGISVLLIALVGATYAYFSAQAGGTTTRDVSVTSNTTDNLSFTISNDISFTVSTANFYQGGNNVSGEATATATLTPNNKTNQATMNYYMYLNLTSNPTVYSTGNTNEDAELILQVFDSNNQLVTLTGLGSQVALGSGYGYDITGQTGLITLLDNHAITANGSTATENWRVVITLVNLNIDQNDNGGKTVTGEIIMTKTSAEAGPCDDKPNDLMCYTTLNYSASTMATGTTNVLYYHNENLEDGAEDGSYRYSGSNPNNYVCFGSDAATCPAENLYRIIGFMPVDVVTDSSTNPVTTERQMLYKLIKSDYATETTFGITSPSNAFKYSWGAFTGPANNEVVGDVDAFYRSGSDSNPSNTWGDSTFNTNVLNGSYLTNLGGTWSSKIANVIWKVGGNSSSSIYGADNGNSLYTKEITYSGVNVDNYPYGCDGGAISETWCPSTDSIIDYPAKVGLMYINEYVFSANQDYWDCWAGQYDICGSSPYTWLYRGVEETTITRDASGSETIYNITNSNGYDFSYGNTASAVRPTFYLTKDTTIDRTLHTGTQADPYRVL